MRIDKPNPKQVEFLTATERYVAFGGARGGGKSWSVRTKAVLLCCNYPGIKVLIVRRTYPELMSNHIEILRRDCKDMAKYNEKDKILRFINGSIIKFMYCDSDRDLMNFQGQEYHIIFLDEATQLSEHQMREISAILRSGADDGFPRRMYFTCNPGGQGHQYIKRLFIDKNYFTGENPKNYKFIQSLVTDNIALMQADPEYIHTLEALPPALREAWLYGRWDVFAGQFFAEFKDDPEHYKDGKWTHVIAPFEPKKHWQIYRSYDFGYNKPFSCGWWCIDDDGVVYRIAELYGCTETANEGVKWNPEKQFTEIEKIEKSHPYLMGKEIFGVADPSIWDRSRGEAVNDAAIRHGIKFTPGDNHRIAGWMQMHYRMAFNEDGYPMMYVFNTCRSFIRTIPTLQFSQTHPEDLDSAQEDHIADESRYFLMSRPIPATTTSIEVRVPREDPLNMFS